MNKSMNRSKSERYGAMSGYLVLALGMVGSAFERGAPPASAPIQETLSFVSQYRSELLLQSLFFVLSAGAYLWFFGSLRAFLKQAGSDTDRLSTVCFGSGVIWAGMQMIFQSVQVTMAMGAGVSTEPMIVRMLSDLAYSLSVIAYVPMATMLAAVAVLSLRAGVLPAWVGWLSAVTAMANLLMSFGIVVATGPLVPGGVMTYLLYGLTVVWLVAVTTVMVVRQNSLLAPVRRTVS